MTNQFAGCYELNIEHAMEALKPIGFDMVQRLLAAMAVPPASMKVMARGAIVGSRGELEHGALFGMCRAAAMQCANCKEKNGVPTNAIVPSTKKWARRPPRSTSPLTHVDASYVRSHFDAIEVRVPATRPPPTKWCSRPRDSRRRTARTCARQRARQRRRLGKDGLRLNHAACSTEGR